MVPQKNANGVVLPAGEMMIHAYGVGTPMRLLTQVSVMDNPTVAAATGANVVSLGTAMQYGQQGHCWVQTAKYRHHNSLER
ncbi:hypothetical protein O9929_17655 [Vibrio lentus]|nr:hypothetical protein [Vibrio lentus]